jgi:aspartate aminotransferase
MAFASNFPANVVPQAPEDALFGLMRQYRADESKSKVDLVSLKLDQQLLGAMGLE